LKKVSQNNMFISQSYQSSLLQYAGRKDVTTCLEFSLGETNVKTHMTISYLGDEQTNPNFHSALSSFVDMAENYKGTEVTVVGHSNFGPKNDIPVLLVEVVNVDPLLEFHQSFGQTEPNMTEFLPVPNFHISLKFADQAPFREMAVGTKLTAKKICLKRLGNIPDVYSKNL
jgi:hypothetical protein